MPFAYTTQAQVRAAFWLEHTQLEQRARANGTRSKGQNAQTTDCRVAFVDFVDALSRNGDISPTLAGRVTL